MHPEQRGVPVLGHPRSRPSWTATAVAFARAVGVGPAHDPVAGAVLPSPDAIAAEVVRGLTAKVGPASLAVRLATGGLTAHAVLRMAAIDRVVERALGAGCEQLVVLGAGFDTRAWRLDALAGTTIFEVDLPEIQEGKRQRLEGWTTATAVRFAAADLASDDLGAILEDAGHDATAPTVWVWEGVVPYLGRDAVEATIAAIGARSAAGSHLAFTFAEPELLGSGLVSRVTDPLVRLAFAGIGEPLRTTLSDSDAGRLVVAAGFDPPEITGVPDWASDGPVGAFPDLFTAERLAVAVRSIGP